jgi:hypothetical protein
MNGPAETVRRGPSSTPHQRLYIRCLCQQLDLDTRRVTLFHRRFWASAKLPEPPLGTDFDAYLCSLTKTEASRLAAVIKEEVPNDE